MSEASSRAKEHLLPPVWLVRAGRHGEDEAAALEQGLSIIGFVEVSDLGKCKSSDDILQTVRSTRPEAREANIRNRSSQLAAFVLRMKEGDTVILPLKSRAGRIALGRVSGQYSFREVGGELRHTRPVEWVRPDVPRTDIKQDLLYSLGAFLTVCRIQRNDAERRIAAVLMGGVDPGSVNAVPGGRKAEVEEAELTDDTVELGQLAHDQILSHIQSRFVGHDLAKLVDAILQADGWTTRLSPPGPDGGVDILGGRGPLGLDSPRLCVQVKSSIAPSDVSIFRGLQGSMQTFAAEQGLLVCWGGFTRALSQEARQSFFSVRLWSASDVVDAVYRTYDQLPEEIQAELPLKRVWTLVVEEPNA